MARGDRRRPPPPDLPSLLFDQRIVYLGMPVSGLDLLLVSAVSCGSDCFSACVLPWCLGYDHSNNQLHHQLQTCALFVMQLVPAVTELMVAELLYLEKQGQQLPIEMLINSSGTTRQDGEIVSRIWPCTVLVHASKRPTRIAPGYQQVASSSSNVGKVLGLESCMPL
jgi:ATP-dependent protease ClpP protease subunit